MSAQQTIVAYLEREFPGGLVEVAENLEKDRIAFSVHYQEKCYLLKADCQYLAELNEAQLAKALQDFSVADVMRGLIDFPVTLTEYGCIF